MSAHSLSLCSFCKGKGTTDTSNIRVTLSCNSKRQPLLIEQGRQQYFITPRFHGLRMSRCLHLNTCVLHFGTEMGEKTSSRLDFVLLFGHDK